MEWNVPDNWMPLVYVCGGFIGAIVLLYALALVSGVNRD